MLVSFYRSGEDSAFERHRSRVTFDQASQSNVAAVKKHLTEFLGLKELAIKFGMVDFDLKLFRLKRISNGKTENYSKESLKRTTKWDAQYFTQEKSYYPVPESSMSLKMLT